VASALVLSACSDDGGSADDSAGKNLDGRGAISFAMGKNDLDLIRPVVASWNKAHADEQVKLVELPGEADDQRSRLVQSLQAKNSEFDVMALDVTWTAEFAANGWLEPLTGDLAIDIARRTPQAEVVGVDPSARMLDVGQKKIEKFGGRITLTVGDAQALAFPDGSFDAVTIAFGIRNVPDRALALREMARVCRPGARVAILELGEPEGGVMAPLARFHIRQVVPRLGALLSGAREYRYLQTSIAAFPPPAEFAAMMTAAGLTVLEVVPLTFGVCNLYVGTPSRERA